MERQERVKQEYLDLQEKITKLERYQVEHREELDKEDYALLTAQGYAMNLYLGILAKRIERFS